MGSGSGLSGKWGEWEVWKWEVEVGSVEVEGGFGYFFVGDWERSPGSAVGFGYFLIISTFTTGEDTCLRHFQYF